MSAVITATELRKSFASRQKGKSVDAVRGMSLEVERGEILGFLGPNGAGKTTTLRMLTTLLPIDAGEAVVAGFDVRRRPKDVRQRIGYVSQQGGADEAATGRENLVLQGRLYRDDKATVRRRVDEVLEVLDLSSFAERRVRTYSGGQRRRLDIGLGVVHQPEVLFLDEPSTGLDPQNRAGLWDYVRALRELGTTVFITTHYLEEADALCDRVMIVDHGRIVAQGTTRELKRQVLGDSVLLTLAGGEPAGAQALTLLAGAGFVREASVSGDQLRLYVEDGGAVLPDLLRMLDAERITLKSISLAEPSLDDVFLAKTGRSLRDAGPPGDPAQAGEQDGTAGDGTGDKERAA